MSAAENGTPVSVEAQRPRRRMKVILTLALSGTLGGFLISYLFTPKYTSQSTVLVEGQKVPESYVTPVITADFAQRVQTLSQEIMSTTRLRPVIESLNLIKPDEENKLIEDIQHNTQFEPVITSMGAAAAQESDSGAKKEPSATIGNVPGVNIVYTDSSAESAQKICNALTELILNENLRERAAIAGSTTDFLQRQVDDTKADLLAKGTQLLAISQSRSPRSAESEAKYKVLALEYGVAQKNYEDLLTKLTKGRLGMSMENQQQGEQMHVVLAASLPDSPDFPNRSLFALGGLGAGLLLGIGRILWPATRKLFQRLALLFPIDTEIEELS